jgi:hypothetical protein
MNTATSFATKDTNMRLLFCARWTVLLQHLTAAHCVCVWIVCVCLSARLRTHACQGAFQLMEISLGLASVHLALLF